MLGGEGGGALQKVYLLTRAHALAGQLRTKQGFYDSCRACLLRGRRGRRLLPSGANAFCQLKGRPAWWCYQAHSSLMSRLIPWEEIRQEKEKTNPPD